MQNYLKGQKLWKYITGKEKVLAEDDAKYEEYESEIEKINSRIANSVRGSHYW